MKQKLLALILATALFAACSPIGSNSTPTGTSSTPTETPIEKVDFETALYSMPDTDAKDGFFSELFAAGTRGILKFSSVVPTIENYEKKNGEYKGTYQLVTKIDGDIPITNDDGTLTFPLTTELTKKINMDDFFARYGLETGFLTGEVTGHISDYSKKAFEKTDATSRIMNRYLWAKHYGFLADNYDSNGSMGRWEKKYEDYPFVDKEKGAANYPILNAELSALAENYLKAKFEGVPLTTTTSKYFDKTLIEKTNDYLKLQGIDSSKVTLDIIEVQPNIYTTYPTVGVRYNITDKNDSMNYVQLTQLFIFDIEMISENEFKYNLEYITDMSSKNENKHIDYDDYIKELFWHVPREYE